MANTLQGHRTGILNWYDYPISSGPMEGVNNKIGALQRAAYAVQRSAILHTQTLRTPRGEIQIPCLNTCNTRRTVFDVEPKMRVGPEEIHNRLVVWNDDSNRTKLPIRS